MLRRKRLHRFRKAIRAGIAARRNGNLVALALALTVGIVTPAHAAGLPRIASINLCTDQLLMTLADPVQIVGLSPYSRDAARSYAAEEAKKYRRLSGEAEDVLMLRPDVVVATQYTKRATRELLKQQGMRVAEFDVATSIDDVKEQIRRMGDLVRHPDRAEIADRAARRRDCPRKGGGGAQALSGAGAVATRLGVGRRQPRQCIAFGRRVVERGIRSWHYARRIYQA